VRRFLGLAGLLLACPRAGAPAERPETPASEPAKPKAKTLTTAELAAQAMPKVVTVRRDEGLGSGFVVKENGWIATNAHVVDGAEELVVVLADGSEHPVTDVLAMDREHDLAILRIDKKGLPTLALGDSKAVRPGDPVVAIGHPLGLRDTVSNGLISAVRVVHPTLSLLQISAPIAPGSSGGPLLDDKGRVIGIATAVSREGQNLNFGIPSEYLATIMKKTSPKPWREFVAEQVRPAFPGVKRDVPNHHVSMLNGCGDGDLQLVVHMLGEAIEIGAPLFNAGNFAACYHVYEGASSDLQRRLGAGCTGPKRALGEGRRKASLLSDPAPQAWAMRDSFDGLLDVIVRKFRQSPR
jgi:hypothetical protein